MHSGERNSKMGSRVEKIVVLVLAMAVGYGVANLEQDKAECTDKVIGLATCLPFVGGTAKAPTVDCCNGLKQVLQSSMKCLCVLIKDHDDPSLGLNINATLAATLPSTCHAPANITHCIDLLQLPPSSPAAKEFAGYANLTQAVASSTGNKTSSSGSGSTTEEKSDGGMGTTRRWVGVDVITIGFVVTWLLQFT